MPPPDEVRVHIPTPDEIAADLKASQRTALREITALANKCKKLTAPIETEAEQRAAQDAYKDLHDAGKEWNGVRIKEKEPYLAASRAVDSYFAAVSERVKEVLGALNGELAGFLRKKEAAIRAKREADARRAREEQERREREAREAREAAEAARRALEEAEREERSKREVAARQRALADAEEKVDFRQAVADGAGENVRVAEARASVAPAEIARTRGDSSLGTLRREFDFVIDDAGAIPLEALRPFLKFEHIEAAVRAMVRVHGDGKPLAGVRVFETKKANVR